MYICMYVCVCIVCECKGLESRLAWHHNLGVMETIRSQIVNNRYLWGVGGGMQDRLTASFSRGDCCVPAVALAEASAGWGGGGGRKIRLRVFGLGASRRTNMLRLLV